MRERLLAVLCALIFLGPAVSAETGKNQSNECKEETPVVVLDLATQDPGTRETRPIPARKDLCLRIENMVGDDQASYQVEIELIENPVDPLSFPTIQTNVKAGAVKLAGGSESCSKNFLKSIQGLKTEKEVRSAVQAALAVKPGCANDQVLNGLIETYTRRKFHIDAVPKGDEVVVTVQRLGSPAKTWILVLETPSRGEWRFSYGFTFLPNQDKKFFTEQDAEDPSLFRIREQNDREDLDFLPSVMYHWHNPASEKDWWKPGFIAGLGWDLEEPAIFLGPGWTVHQNVTVTLGAAIHRFEDLAGRYNVGQTLMEDLEASNLVERSYGVNFYFGVAFRFGENIFQRRDEAIKARRDREAANASQQAQQQAQAEEKRRRLENAERLIQADLVLCEKKAETEHAKALAGDPPPNESQKAKLVAELNEAKAQCALEAEQARKKARDAAASEDPRITCLTEADSNLEEAKTACEAMKEPPQEAKEKCETDHADNDTEKKKCLEMALKEAKEKCVEEADEAAKKARAACVGAS